MSLIFPTLKEIKECKDFIRFQTRSTPKKNTLNASEKSEFLLFSKKIKCMKNLSEDFGGWWKSHLEPRREDCIVIISLSSYQYSMIMSQSTEY